MNGPDHYRKAEELIAALGDWDYTNPDQLAIVDQLTYEAQIHASLALVAATVHGVIGNDVSSNADIDTLGELSTTWLDAIGGN